PPPAAAPPAAPPGGPSRHSSAVPPSHGSRNVPAALWARVDRTLSTPRSAITTKSPRLWIHSPHSSLTAASPRFHPALSANDSRLSSSGCRRTWLNACAQPSTGAGSRLTGTDGG